VTDVPETPAALDAYALLSKPTLDISDPEALLIIEDLRKRRKAYLTTGKPDKQPKPKAPASPKVKADKAANTANLLALLEASNGPLKLS
jgi:hypothetical protein